LILDAPGNYAVVLVNPERPKKCSGKTCEEISAEEYKSAGMGFSGQFGRWYGKTLVRKLTAGFNPLNRGNEQKPQLQLNGDELKLIDLNSGITGGRVEQTYRRAK
jgi:hypothetical protein